MSFNYKEYSDAMDDFLLQMEQIHSHTHPDIAKALKRLCVLLRIAKVEVSLFETAMDVALNHSENGCFYCEGEADESRALVYSETAENGNVARYRFVALAGSADWDEMEVDKIRLLSKMLFVYNGRSRILKLVEKLIFRDPQLKIYNHAYFMKTCGMLIKAECIGNYGACYFNLKRFSHVNQQIGRDEATRVMASFIRGLQEILVEEECICRIGGDNFIVLFRKENFESVLDYLKGCGMPYGKENDSKIFIGTTAGYYLISEHTQNADEIMDNVSIAFNHAKNISSEPYVVYTEELAESIKESRELEELFPVALEKEEFEAYYQPKVALKDYTLAGAEALCRWFHDGKMVMPGKFIPVFERTKAITMLDFYMLEHVCKDIRKWLDEGRKVVKVSVNFSRRHMGDMNLLERILEIVDKYQVPHEYIEIELTETTTDVDFKDLREIVNGLQAAGICTSVDDFGMGYSSLNLIKELPWNVLKIDRSLLQPIADGEENGSILLKHVISMAQEIGLECLVEGVETAEQVKFLKQNNCFLAQGFFFDRPLPRAEFEKRMDEIQS